MKRLYPFVIMLSFLLIGTGWAQQPQAAVDSLNQKIKRLEAAVKQLQQKEAVNELEKLREAARQAARKKTAETAELKIKSFKEGSRSLQKLNPEISVTGDMLTRYLIDKPHYTDDARSGFLFRVLGLHFQSNLDPFSFAKVAIEFGADGAEVGEAYATWINPLPRMNLTLGKFRQQFGVINRWHEHALDQSSFPLPIQLYMGEEGLNQVGLSLDYLLPSLTAQVNELTFQLTNAQNEHLFSGRKFGLPALLLHWKNYYDLNRNTYLEWGLTGLAGANDTLGFNFDSGHRWTYMGGLDLTLSWTPVNQALYKGFTWRTELFYLNKELDGLNTIKALGGYSYLDYRLSQQVIAGLRMDAAQPPVLDNADQLLWQIVPYLTFWQSEFVKLRLEYHHLEGRNLDQKDNRMILQIDWAVGPHKHERY